MTEEGDLGKCDECCTAPAVMTLVEPNSGNPWWFMCEKCAQEFARDIMRQVFPGWDKEE